LVQSPSPRTFGDVPPPSPHTTWDHLLKKHVKNGLVDYKGFAKDIKRLDNYLDQLNKANISGFSKEQKLAYWINAYNAFTVKLILNHYPTKSIRKISRPWKRKEWNAAGKPVSLDQIEHKILRKEFKEPRIHFAIVCASIGCPDLQPFAFTAGKLEKQLTLAAKQFFSSPKHFQLDRDGDRVIIRISKIFSWFGKDFGADKRERAYFMFPYLDIETGNKIKMAETIKFKYKSYDWNLNEQ
jgi:hypothetical protein